eukprot:7931898-Pyramimonas_sp.AAC.1
MTWVPAAAPAGGSGDRPSPSPPPPGYPSLPPAPAAQGTLQLPSWLTDLLPGLRGGNPGE